MATPFLATCRRLTEGLVYPALAAVLAFAASALLWPQDRSTAWLRLAPVPLLLLDCFAWGLLSAAIARRTELSPKGCYLFGIVTFAAAAGALLWCMPARHEFVALASLAGTAGYFCRKLVYPEFTAAEFAEDAEGLTVLHLTR
jgi:hypothetical protein